MDQLGLKRYCCRRMVMTHVDLIEKLLKYDQQPILRISPSNQSAYSNGLTDITPPSATLAKLRSISRILWADFGVYTNNGAWWSTRKMARRFFEDSGME
jgi:hypothetical protein